MKLNQVGTPRCLCEVTVDMSARLVDVDTGMQMWSERFDSRIEDVPNWRVSVRSDQPPIQAASLEETSASDPQQN